MLQLSFILRLLKVFAVQRAGAAAFGFSAVLLGGGVLEESVAADLLLIMFLAKFLHLTNFGATNGYLISKYGAGDAIGTHADSTDGLRDRDYAIGFVLHSLAICIVLIIISAAFAPAYLAGILAYLIVTPLFALEPVLRRRRNFFWSLLPDLVLSVSLLAVSLAAVAGLTFEARAGAGGASVMFLCVLLTMVVSALAFRLSRAKRYCDTTMSYTPLRAYGGILFLGLPAYAGTAFFILASGMDRFFLPLHIEGADRALYLLSYQLTTGAAVFMTALNFVTTVDLGEAHRSASGIQVSALRQKLTLGFAIALPSLLALMIGCMILERTVLTNYEGLTELTMTLAVGLFAFLLTGVVTPALQYMRRQWPLSAAMGLAALLLFTNNLWAMERGYGVNYLAVVTATVLLAYAIFALFFTYTAIRLSGDAN